MLDSRRRFMKTAAGVAACLPGMGLAMNARADSLQAWPARPVQLVLGYPTGGATDGVARPLELMLKDSLGQPVVFDYRPGAGATIGAAYVARAKPDGYTLHVTDSGPMTILPNGRKVGYDPLTGFTPVGMVCEGASIIVVHPSVPAHTLEELITLAKRDPGAIGFGTSGLGGAAHLSGELFQAMTGTQLVHIPYRGGSQAAIDLVGGQIPMAFASTGTALPFVKSGKMRALAVTSSQRVSIFPDVPTVAEAGYPDYDATVWFAIVGPAGLPDPIVARFNHALQDALGAQSTKDTLRAQGYEPAAGTPQMLAQRLRADYEKWGNLIREKQIAFE
ncbi:tripartite tricarboxylate transporter substrate binding protein [Pollutimonas sp. H1-120]|uniref:Bug family tripartite tricarboxylate transporter substrate binding protein n=1 Tax=Pollutimonas sp. H1-120 TaxID=3148824 RepID=UPI003B5235AA